MDLRRIYYEWRYWVKIVDENDIAWVTRDGKFITKLPEYYDMMIDNPHEYNHLLEQINIMCDQAARKGL